MRRIRTIAVFPTMFTLANLVCGFFAIVVAARVEPPTSSATPTTGELPFRSPVGIVRGFDKTDATHNAMLSGWLIFLAMIFDALDGYVARLAKTSSDFGAQLDSLCDLVTFGVAPGFLLVKMCPNTEYLHSQRIWIIAAFFAVCVALRLARFNVETGEDDDHTKFHGLPSPAGAAALAGFAILFYTLRAESAQWELRLWGMNITSEGLDRVVQETLPFFAVLVGILMVSRIPYPHLVNNVLRGNSSFGFVVGLVVALGAVMLIKGYAVPIVCVGFVLVPPIRFFWNRFYQHRAQEEPLF